MVGDDSVESDAEVEVLFLGWWKDAKDGGGANVRWTSVTTGEAGGAARSGSRPWTATGAQAGSRTWMKDGSGSAKAGDGGDCIIGER